MPEIRVTIAGVEVVNARLSRLQGMRWAVRPMRRSVLLLQNRMAQYPPQRPGSRYVRTGTLGRSWTTQVQESSERVVGIVGNKVEYAPWVQSQRFQAAIHRGRWRTDEQVAEQSREEIGELFRQGVEEASR
jgi:hypothetical protein